MTDWTGIAAVIAPFTTLFGVLGGYMLAGRNEDARDQRAAQRQVQIQRDAFTEQLEHDRHTFQRDTLLQLQDDLQSLTRATTRVVMQDQKTIKEKGQLFLLPDNVGGEEARLITASVQRLRARVLDDQLRATVGEFAGTCARASTARRNYPGGHVPDSGREIPIAGLESLENEMDQAYDQLIEALGVQIRRELDHRYLITEPQQGPSSPPLGAPGEVA
jgi:hypothetical protein